MFEAHHVYFRVGLLFVVRNIAGPYLCNEVHHEGAQGTRIDDYTHLYEDGAKLVYVAERRRFQGFIFTRCAENTFRRYVAWVLIQRLRREPFDFVTDARDPKVGEIGRVAVNKYVVL